MKTFKSKLFIQFFYSSFVIFMIPLLVFSSVIYLYTRMVIRQSQIEAFSASMEANASDMDEILYYIHNVAFEMSYNDAVYEVDGNRFGNVVDLNLAAKNVIREMKVSGTRFAMSHNILLGLYTASNGVVLTNSTKYSLEDYCKGILQLKPSRLDAEIFIELSASENQTLLLPADTNSKGNLIYILPLNMYGAPSNTFMLAAIPVHLVMGFHQPNVYSAVYMGSEPLASDNARLFSPQALPTLQNGRMVRYEGKSYLPVRTTSALMDLTYISCVDQAIVEGRVRLIYISLLLLIALVFFLGTVFAYQLSKRHYRPVRDILKIVETCGNPIPAGSGGRPDNEYTRIGEALDGLVKNNTLLRQQMEDQLPLLQSAFLGRLLREPFDSRRAGDAQQYGIQFRFARFAVLTISMACANPSPFAADLFKSVVSAALSHAYKDYTVYAADDFRSFVPLIVNFSEPQSAEGLARALIRQLPEQTLAGCSETVCTAQSLHLAYTQSIEALNAGLFSDQMGVVFYASLTQKGGSLSYSAEREQALSGSLRDKDSAQARRMLHEIVRENAARNAKHPLVLKLLLEDLLATLIKTASEMGADIGSLWDEERARQFDAVQIQQKEELLGQLADQIGEQARERCGASSPLIEGILCYIHAQYRDSSLSLNQTADHFRVSPQYVSGLFKSQVGKNFTEYLNQHRLKMSLDFLMELNLSIGEIAEKVGYMGAGNYIRVFKKYYSVTPGQYRDRLSRTVDSQP